MYLNVGHLAVNADLPTPPPKYRGFQQNSEERESTGIVRELLHDKPVFTTLI